MKKYLLAIAALLASLTVCYTRPIASISFSGVMPLACDSDVIAIGGNIQITMPSASGLVDGCDIVLANEDSAAGKFLINFPADINPKLYPNQAVGFTTRNQQWVSKMKPGRWKIPPNTFVYVANGGNDNNDGLSQSTPLQHNSVATNIVQVDFDIRQTTPYIALQGGSNFINDPITLGGQPTGGNLIGLTVYGSGTATITNADDAAILGGDNAELDIEVGMLSGPAVALVLQGNQNDHPNRAAGIYDHNNFLYDMNLSPAGKQGGLTIIGNGPNGSAIFYDGPTAGASSSGTVNVAGVFYDIFHMDEGGRFTFGTVVQPIPMNGSSASVVQILTVLGNSQLLLGGGANQFPSGYANPPGPSIVAGAALLVTGGISIPGGIVDQQNGHHYQNKVCPASVSPCI